MRSVITHNSHEGKAPLQLSIFGWVLLISSLHSTFSSTSLRDTRIIFFVMSPTLTFYYSCAFHSPTYRLQFLFISCLFFFLHFLNFSFSLLSPPNGVKWRKNLRWNLSWLMKTTKHLNLNEIKSIHKFHLLTSLIRLSEFAPMWEDLLRWMMCVSS